MRSTSGVMIANIIVDSIPGSAIAPCYHQLDTGTLLSISSFGVHALCSRHGSRQPLKGFGVAQAIVIKGSNQSKNRKIISLSTFPAVFTHPIGVFL